MTNVMLKLWIGAASLCALSPAAALAQTTASPSAAVPATAAAPASAAASAPASAAVATEPSNGKPNDCVVVREKPLRLLDKSWLLVGVDSTMAAWKDRTIGAVFDYVPWVSDHAVWLGFQGAATYDYQAIHRARFAAGPELGYSWFSLFSGMTYDARGSHVPFGWRSKLSLLIPVEIAAGSREFSRAACCQARECGCPIWSSEYQTMKCVCDRDIIAIVIRPYFQLDYYSSDSFRDPPAPQSSGEPAPKGKWIPTFGLSANFAYGWGG